MFWIFSFQDKGVHKIAKKTHVERFSIFDVKYSFNKIIVTQTFRNPVKFNKNSTRKTKKKNFLRCILQYITPWNHNNVRNCYSGGYFRGLQTNVEFYFILFFMILLISEIFSLYLLVKMSYNFKLDFFTYFEHILGGIIRKNSFTFRLP